MSEVPFHLTLMGRRFYEATMPALVEAIERLNRNLERLSTTGGQRGENPPPPAAATGGDADAQPGAGRE